MNNKGRNPAWVLFFFLLSLASCWAAIQPVYSIADEPQHVIKALAVSRGIFTGPRTTGQAGYAAMEFEVPNAYSNTSSWQCFNGKVDISPTCSGEMLNDSSTIPVASTAAEYPPLYYGLVGWVGWQFPGPWGLLAMRLLTALIFSMIIGFAGYVFALEKKIVGQLGLIIAATPMVMSFAGSVNPFAIEVAASILFWTTSLALYQNCDNAANRKRLIILLYGAGFLFGVLRPGSFVWILPITLLILIASISNFDDSTKASRRNSSNHTILAGFIGTVISVSWFLIGMSNRNLGGSAEPVGGSILSNMRISFEETDDFIRQMFGTFGWLEFHAPLAVSATLFGLIVFLYARAEPLNTGVRLSLILTTLFIVFGPMFLEGARASTSGWGFQGRYLLPVAVGIPIIVIRNLPIREPQSPPVHFLAVVAVSAHLIALNHAARRFFSGLGGPYFWFTRTTWNGILGPYVTIISIVLLLISSTLLILQLSKFQISPTNKGRNMIDNEVCQQ